MKALTELGETDILQKMFFHHIENSFGDTTE